MRGFGVWAARAAWVFFVLTLMVATLEFGLRRFMGFGSPILYDNSYAWGYRPLPNQTTHRTGRKQIRINNLALRAVRDWTASPSRDQLRILYLGDSVTYGGSYVDDRETFAEVSAEKLRGTLGRDVLAGNAAVNAWGPRNIEGLVSRFGSFGADLVVIVALEDDLVRDLTRIGEVPFWNQRPSSAIEEVLSSWVAYRLNIRRYRYKNAFVSKAELDSVCATNIERYMEIGRTLGAQGARVLMVWHPLRDAATGKTADPHREPFLKACRDAGLPSLDLLPVLQAERDPAALYVDAAHLHPRGHALYGSVLATALAAQVP